MNDNYANLYTESIKSAILDIKSDSNYRFVGLSFKDGVKFKTYDYDWPTFISLQIKGLEKVCFDCFKIVQDSIKVLPFKKTLHLWLKGRLIDFNTARLDSHLLMIQQKINQLLQGYFDVVYFSGDSMLTAMTVKYSPEIFFDMAGKSGIARSKSIDAVRDIQVLAEKAILKNKKTLGKNYGLKEIPRHHLIRSAVVKYGQILRFGERNPEKQINELAL